MTAAGPTLGHAYIEIDARIDRFVSRLRSALAAFAAKVAALNLLKKLNTVAGTLGKSLLIAGGALAGLAVAGALSVKIIALVSALLQLTGVIASLPAYATIAIGAVAGLALAVHGLGEAFGAALEGDAGKFSKALEKLSPQARKLAEEFRSVVPQLKSIQRAAQDAFSGRVVGQLGQTVKVLTGPLTVGLTKVAAAWGDAAANLLKYLRSAEEIDFLNKLLDSSSVALGGLLKDVVPLIEGFERLSLAGLGFVTRTTGGLGTLGDKFNAFAQRVVENGSFDRFLSNGVEVFNALGRVLRDLGAGLYNMFKVADDAGGGFLQTLAASSKQFREWVSSVEGQETLTRIFTNLTALAHGLAPVFGNLADAVGSVLGALGPAIQAIVPVIVALSDALGPALGAIAGPLGDILLKVVDLTATLVPYVIPLGQALAGLLQILAPLSDLFVNLYEPIQPLIESIAGLAAAIQPIVNVLGPLLNQILSSIYAALVPLFGGITGVIAAIAQPLADLLAALGGALAPIMAALVPVLDAVVQVIVALVPVLADLLPPITEIIIAVTPLIALVASFAAGALQLLAPLIKLAIILLRFVAIKPIVLLVTQLADALTLALAPLTFLSDAMMEFANWLQSLSMQNVINGLNQVSDVLIAIGEGIGKFFGDMWTQLWDNAKQAFTDGINSLVSIALTLPQLLAALPGQLFSFGVDLIMKLAAGIQSRVGDIGGSVIGALRGFINNVVISRLNQAIGFIDDKLPFVDLPRISFLAAGDVVRKPTAAVVGEAGPEAVIPLTRPRRALQLLEESGLADLVRGAARGAGSIVVRVFLGTREITDIVRVEVDQALEGVAGNVLNGARP